MNSIKIKRNLLNILGYTLRNLKSNPCFVWLHCFLGEFANFTNVKDEPAGSPWAELREAQLQTLQIKNTRMAVVIDLGEAKNIHPRNKQDVSLRLALK